MKIEYAPASSLRPEQRVEIEAAGGDWPGLYISRINSVAGKDITLDAPIRDGVFVPLHPDTALVVRAMSPAGLLSFDTVVVERRAGAHPTIVVTRPARLMIVQRRAFYRVSVGLPALFDRATSAEITDFVSGRTEAGVVVDLSGGGAALRTATPLRPGEWLRLRLPMDDRFGDFLAPAEVIDTELRRTRFDSERIARLRFSGLSQRDEDRLFRFINSLERSRLKDRRSFRDG